MQQQLELESLSLRMGHDRHMGRHAKDMQRGNVGSVASRLIDKAMPACVLSVSVLQQDVETRFHTRLTTATGSFKHALLLVAALEPEVVAHLTVRSVLTVLRRYRTVTSVAAYISRNLEDHLWLTEVRELERDRAKSEGTYSRIPYLTRDIETYGPRVVKRWRKVLQELPTREWSSVDRTHVGTALLNAVLPHLGDVVKISSPARRQKQVHIRNSFVESLSQEAGRVAMMRPFYLPMLCRPRPWSAQGWTLDGGYLALKADGLKARRVRGAGKGHTQAGDLSEGHLAALNRLQGTAWMVNRFVLDVAQVAFQSDTGPLPYKAPVVIPERFSDDMWSEMTDEERKTHLVKVSRAHQHNFRQAEAKLAHTRAITVADMMKDYPDIWFPHAMDYRGRMYPIPQDLHPQGSDIVKSLLLFAKPKPLGERGWAWLLQHAAATYGLDKESRTDQLQWCSDNIVRVCRVGDNPWLDTEFWQQADEPWQFLAAAREIYSAAASGNVETYLCSLPISVDGSCNGLQHLSALGLDPVGGKAVNLTPGPRQDIYQIVADKVVRSVEQSSDPMSNLWDGRVTRKTVKRAVMTTPYGVTLRGIADQLVSDGFTDGMEEPHQAAAFLRDRIVEALDGTLVKGMDVMRWFKDCANVLSKSDQGVSWETPIGSVITMTHMRDAETRVMTPFGYLRVLRPDAKPSLASHKQANSVSPNVIHSFDAAHMAMVINRTDGLDLAMVHDSYGTHPCDVDTLIDTTKEVFEEIYAEDWFHKLRASMIFHSSRPTLPACPDRGKLDIKQVRYSEYFFA